MGYIGTKPANQVVDGFLLSDGSVTTNDLANGSITTDKIAAGAVITEDLANSSVTTDKIANSSVGVSKLSATGTPSSTTYLRGDNTWAAIAAGLGDGQTYQNVTGSRAVGTTYTNTTGKPIFVAICNCYSTSGTVSHNLTIGGQTAASGIAWHTNAYTSIYGVVPPGATYSYSYSGAGTGYTWFELR